MCVSEWSENSFDMDGTGDENSDDDIATPGNDSGTGRGVATVRGGGTGRGAGMGRGAGRAIVMGRGTVMNGATGNVGRGRMRRGGARGRGQTQYNNLPIIGHHISMIILVINPGIINYR